MNTPVVRRPPFEPVPCPQCQTLSPSWDWNEVDIGVGYQVYDQSWMCPHHGEFGFGEKGEAIFRDPPEEES